MPPEQANTTAERTQGERLKNGGITVTCSQLLTHALHHALDTEAPGYSGNPNGHGPYQTSWEDDPLKETSYNCDERQALSFNMVEGIPDGFLFSIFIS